MKIFEMFEKDINRAINGVVQVNQDDDAIIKQEVEEYVVTKELKKHFVNFFNYYSASFDTQTYDTGVWISGFFGSGKSHFLKMLSYILENKIIDGKSTVEVFREKFKDDPGSFLNIDKATRNKTEVILFDIGAASGGDGGNAVLKVFSKMFFNHCGFYGENLKIALMEQYIDSLGKTREFRDNIKELTGKPWETMRKAILFKRAYVITALAKTLDISENDALEWINDKEHIDYSVVRFVEDVKAYVRRQPKDYRLLFMVDEVGQFVADNKEKLLNLQNIVEEIGSKCKGKVWVVCTGQEAVDGLVKVNVNAFSRILDRFKTRLALSSSAVDEVIQKRLLKKKPAVVKTLENIYNENESILRNLFAFGRNTVRSDIKGFTSSDEYVRDYPFIPYQFTLIQKAYTEIRSHENAGFNMSDGARSMLSGFQESAKKMQNGNEHTLIPFWCFYDTIHSALNSTIRRVIERCQKAADEKNGIEDYDVKVLKALYLVRYIPDEIKADLDNLVILMADNINIDKISVRKMVQDSLDRLLDENYIGKSGGIYNFLTDEEQDIQRNILNTVVDSSAIIKKMHDIIFGEIYAASKFSYGKNAYAFDKIVDTQISGNGSSMKLEFLTAATDEIDKNELSLRAKSMDKVIVVLSAEYKYFEDLEKAARIQRYIQQNSAVQQAQSIREIISRYQEEARNLEKTASAQMEKAIAKGKFYAAGERLDIKSDGAKERINEAMEYLVSNLYNKLELINYHASSDQEIVEVLHGQHMLNGTEYNREAAAEVEQYLELQMQSHRPTSMADIQSKFKEMPYGWTEAEIAYVVAMLIRNQKVTIKYGGATIQPDNPKLIDMLRKRTEIGKTAISKREKISQATVNTVRTFLREYFDEMSIPSDDDGLVKYIVEGFESRRNKYDNLNKRYTNNKYPDREVVIGAIRLVDDILAQKKDNIALCKQVEKSSAELLKSKENMEVVESFFNNQADLFDRALRLLKEIKDDENYFANDEEVIQALNTIRAIVNVDGGRYYKYQRIPELNRLIPIVRAAQERLIEKKRDELYADLETCLASIHQDATAEKQKEAVRDADEFYKSMKEKISLCTGLTTLDGYAMQLFNYKDKTIETMHAKEGMHSAPSGGKKAYRQLNRAIVFPTRILESDADIDRYVEEVRSNLKKLLGNSDGINIK